MASAKLHTGDLFSRSDCLRENFNFKLLPFIDSARTARICRGELPLTTNSVILPSKARVAVKTVPSDILWASDIIRRRVEATAGLKGEAPLNNGHHYYYNYYLHRFCRSIHYIYYYHHHHYYDYYYRTYICYCCHYFN